MVQIYEDCSRVSTVLRIPKPVSFYSPKPQEVHCQSHIAQTTVECVCRNPLRLETSRTYAGSPVYESSIHHGQDPETSPQEFPNNFSRSMHPAKLQRLAQSLPRLSWQRGPRHNALHASLQHAELYPGQGAPREASSTPMQLASPG